MRLESGHKSFIVYISGGRLTSSSSRGHVGRLVTHPNGISFREIEQIKLSFLCLHDVCVWFRLWQRQGEEEEARTLLSRLNLSHSRLRHLSRSRRTNKISLKYKDEKRSKSFLLLKCDDKERSRGATKLNFRGDKISRYLVSFYFGFLRKQVAHKKTILDNNE